MVVIDISVNNEKHQVEVPSASHEHVNEVVGQMFEIPEEELIIVSDHIVLFTGNIREKNEQVFVFTKGEMYVQKNNARTYKGAQHISNVFVLQQSRSVCFFVNTLYGKMMSVSAYKTSSVMDVKRKIHSNYGVPWDVQRICFEGKNLEDDVPLEKYNIENDTVVFLITSLRCMFHYTSGKDGTFDIPTVKCKVIVNNASMEVSVPLGGGAQELHLAVLNSLTIEELLAALKN